MQAHLGLVAFKAVDTAACTHVPEACRMVKGACQKQAALRIKCNRDEFTGVLCKCRDASPSGGVPQNCGVVHGGSCSVAGLRAECQAHDLEAVALECVA